MRDAPRRGRNTSAAARGARQRDELPQGAREPGLRRRRAAERGEQIGEEATDLHRSGFRAGPASKPITARTRPRPPAAAPRPTRGRPAAPPAAGPPLHPGRQRDGGHARGSSTARRRPDRPSSRARAAPGRRWSARAGRRSERRSRPGQLAHAAGGRSCAARYCGAEIAWPSSISSSMLRRYSAACAAKSAACAARRLRRAAPWRPRSCAPTRTRRATPPRRGGPRRPRAPA